MKGNELVWRTIADRALNGERAWSNIGDLAHFSGVPESTAALALKKLDTIGAIRRERRGGFSTVNPEKVLTVLAAWRNLDADCLAKTTLKAAQELMDNTQHPYAIGGPDAAVTYLSEDGRNTIADIGTRIVYSTDRSEARELPVGDDVLVLRLDSRAEVDWYSGVASVAQTYADLFASPGWQAEEFRKALHRTLFAGADWDQRASTSAGTSRAEA